MAYTKDEIAEARCLVMSTVVVFLVVILVSYSVHPRREEDLKTTVARHETQILDLQALLTTFSPHPPRSSQRRRPQNHCGQTLDPELDLQALPTTLSPHTLSQHTLSPHTLSPHTLQ
jgi:hypothetical protein